MAAHHPVGVDLSAFDLLISFGGRSLLDQCIAGWTNGIFHTLFAEVKFGATVVALDGCRGHKVLHKQWDGC
jgi:hypothetical protein